jgi:TPR repeat protein
MHFKFEMDYMSSPACHKQPAFNVSTNFWPLICVASLVAFSSATIFLQPAQASPIGKKQPTSPTGSFKKGLSGKSTATTSVRPIKDKWAVVIGIDTFKDPAIPHLNFAAKDAVDFAKFLTEHGNFAKDHVLLLTNEKATRDNIKSAVGGSWLPRRAQPDDLVLIFASTHGSPKELDVAGENFLVAYDSQAQDLYVTGIRFADLAPEIKSRTGCDRVVLLLDACNSGAANVGGKGLLRSSNFDVTTLAGQGQIVISSSASNQRSFESKRYDNGVFTKQLIAALQAKGNKTTLNQAFNYLKERVETEVRFDRMLTQTPVMRSKWSGGELILIAVPAAPRRIEGDSNSGFIAINAETPDATYLEGAKLVNDKKYFEAFNLIKPAAEAGRPYCQSLLGYLYSNGLGVERSKEKALEWVEKSANQGCVKGLYNLGTMYDQGTEVPQNYKKALELYKKAAEKGLHLGMNAVGTMYGKGKGVAKDYAQAKEWYLKAAEKDLPEAKYNLAQLYYSGQGLTKNYQLAAEWFQKAADQNYTPAQRSLASLYRSGEGVAKNDSKAVEWFQKAAEQEDTTALSFLGYMYENGDGVPQNYTKAAEYYQKAGDQGNTIAQNNLGRLYEIGQGVPKNYDKATQWYQKAADQGEPNGQSNLGYLYETGNGVTQNYARAKEWYQKAAEQGFARAQNNLGHLYNHGLGVTKDYAQASAWYQKAADQGYAKAQANLGFLYNQGLGVPQNYTKARDWYLKAAEQGNAYAQNNLGCLYMNGHGVPKDLTQAREWLNKSAAQGLENAKANLKRLEQLQ